MMTWHVVRGEEIYLVTAEDVDTAIRLLETNFELHGLQRTDLMNVKTSSRWTRRIVKPREALTNLYNHPDIRQ